MNPLVLLAAAERRAGPTDCSDIRIACLPDRSDRQLRLWRVLLQRFAYKPVLKMLEDRPDKSKKESRTRSSQPTTWRKQSGASNY